MRTERAFRPYCRKYRMFHRKSMTNCDRKRVAGECSENPEIVRCRPSEVACGLLGRGTGKTGRQPMENNSKNPRSNAWRNSKLFTKKIPSWSPNSVIRNPTIIWNTRRIFGSRIQANTPYYFPWNLSGIPPFAAPMPPKEYSIKAESVMALGLKIKKWLKRYGYELV